MLCRAEGGLRKGGGELRCRSARPRADAPNNGAGESAIRAASFASTRERSPEGESGEDRVMFGVADQGGTLQGLATIPEFIWELGLSFYPLI